MNFKSKHNGRLPILRIVGTYAIVGSLWIYLSDHILGELVHDPGIMTGIAMFKGILFIAFTALLLYFLIARHVQQTRRAADELTRSEKSLQTFVNTLPDPAFMVDAAGMVLAANESFEQQTGITGAELVGKSANTLPTPETSPLSVERLARVVESGEPVQFENERSGKQYVNYVRPVLDAEGKTTRVAVLAVDITDRKTIEEKLRSSLREKEVLLREIHHRVKNNLQVVSSLLSLQASEIDNEDAKGALRECQARVRSMALVHERLYRAGSLANIDFAEYLQSVTNELLRSFGRPGVVITLDVESVTLEVDTAVPCGLIVNELVSNALKHAFPDKHGGEVTIRLHQKSPGLIELVVHDNGTGIPEGKDLLSQKSMGLVLVQNLLTQIDGTLTLIRSKGTSFVITFPHTRESLRISPVTGPGQSPIAVSKP